MQFRFLKIEFSVSFKKSSLKRWQFRISVEGLSGDISAFSKVKKL